MLYLIVERHKTDIITEDIWGNIVEKKREHLDVSKYIIEIDDKDFPNSDYLEFPNQKTILGLMGYDSDKVSLSKDDDKTVIEYRDRYEQYKDYYTGYILKSKRSFLGDNNCNEVILDRVIKRRNGKKIRDYDRKFETKVYSLDDLYNDKIFDSKIYEDILLDYIDVNEKDLVQSYVKKSEFCVVIKKDLLEYVIVFSPVKQVL